MIRIENLSCGYGKKIVLQDIELDIQTGQFLALIGPNGSGKTTLIRGISGLLPPIAGRVLIDGKVTSKKEHKDLATKVAVVTQSDDTAAAFSVKEFVLMGRMPHWSRFQLLETKQDQQTAEKALTLAGINHLSDRQMGTLSGGERQLVCLARALAQEPALLLLDEPTAHLDIGHQVQIMGLLKQLNSEGLTIVAVLHDLNFASLYCQRLVLLNEGRIRAEGPSREVLTEATINEVYQTVIAVKEDPELGPLVFPISYEPDHRIY